MSCSSSDGGVMDNSEEKPAEKNSWVHKQELGFGPIKDALIQTRESVKATIDGLQKEMERHKAALTRLKGR